MYLFYHSLHNLIESFLSDSVNFLGITIVGQSDKTGPGDGGIYVRSIMKG